MMVPVITSICLGLVLFSLVWLLLVRVIRQRYPLPIPPFMIHLIDNTFRHMVQPMHKAPDRLRVKPA
jgi:hypothetical protein